ncbi:hypothetical protein B0H16DRAFT_1447188 [Mycena metata]|uniref:Uncharacterized protein n=1 Tax=Mycena metata TaxID=1033252 RepID=A0AAD7P0E6_9AGAR|nr:hypothetical protein B0H16DRAFT_1447188 [Mycena metata]
MWKPYLQICAAFPMRPTVLQNLLSLVSLQLFSTRPQILSDGSSQLFYSGATNSWSLNPPHTSLSSSPNSVTLVLPSHAYAQPVDPSYATKITTGNFPVHTHSNQITVYKKATTHTLEVQWWIKDDVAAEVFLVAAPNFPFFHPRDALIIVDFLGGEAAA